MAVDNSGVPVYYKKVNIGAADFKLHHDGTYTYFNALTLKLPDIFGEFIHMDGDFKEIKSYKTSHGLTDLHDFRILNNGNKLMLGVDMIEKDLTHLGGKANAKIWDYFLEEIDDGKVVFDWKTWDNFRVKDIITAYDLSLDYIEHGANCNSFYIDKDENIILSSRKLDEITKIDRQTGKIIWRMGGIRCKNNQFRFIGDRLNGFSHQHSISILNNGNLLVFDNGNHNAKNTGKDNLFFVPQSRIVEYKIDEIKKTAELVWEYQIDGIFAPIMGSCQRLDNGNTIICWSHDSPCITEVNPEGDVVMQLDLPKGFQCYSAYKFNIN